MMVFDCLRFWLGSSLNKLEDLIKEVLSSEEIMELLILSLQNP